MEWPLVRLDSLYDIARGGSPRPIKKFLTDAPDGINWIKIGDATASGKYIYETKEKIIPEGIKRSRFVKQGDFILSNSMSFGRPYIMGVSGCIHDGWLVLSPKDEKIDQDFLYYILGSPFVFQQFDSLASGSTVRNLNIDLVSGVKIPLLPLEEQERIVAILDDAFRGIDAAIANTEKNLTNARELFESYLNNIFTQKGEGWEDTEIGNEIDLLNGFAFKSKDYSVSGDGIKLLRGDNVVQGKFRWDGVKYWPFNKIQGYEKFSLAEGDVILAMDRTWVKAGIKYSKITKEDLPCFLVQRVACLRPKPSLEADYLYYLLGSKLFTTYVLSIQTGIGVPHISGTQIRNFNFSLPPRKMQITILERMKSLQEETRKLEKTYQQKLKALKELKQSLLQKAFAGELTSNSSIETSSPEFTAQVLAFAYYRHASKQRDKTFRHVKAQKILHLTESIGQIDLGRTPIKDAAGPNDFPHMLKAEEWARNNQFFEFIQRPDGGYNFKKLARYNELLTTAKTTIQPFRRQLDKVIDLLLPMNFEESGLFATVHAAWNNLILNDDDITDEAIVYEARENWHPVKMKISKAEFLNTIHLIRNKGLIPDGSAKRVGGQESLL